MASPAKHPAPGTTSSGFTRIEDGDVEDGDLNGAHQSPGHEDSPDGWTMPLHRPLRTRINIYPTILLIFNVMATAFYFYVRWTKTLVPGEAYGYGLFILAVEAFGLTATLPYAILMIISMLPEDKVSHLHAAREGSNGPYNFHVRVLVPCYKEDIEVISATVRGALQGDLPAGTRRTIYLCDDGGDSEKKALMEKWGCEYVTGRTRTKGETNGKSNNLNNVLINVIYNQYKDDKGVVQWELVPWTEVIVVFDADMVAKKHFFLRLLEVMTDPQKALCLSPQSFHNIHPDADIFNHINHQFWEYWLPGAVGWGYNACTGTNFCIRSAPLARVGFFPTYTITEDYALGYELKKLGYNGAYMKDYIAVGEAPAEVRNAMRQRSRWCKGHMQVFFSWKSCPLFQWKLPFSMKLWYSYGTWCYFVNVVTVPTFLLVPFLSLFLGLNPLVINFWFAAAATPYYISIFLVQNYAREFGHLRSLWFSNISNIVLCFTYFKAIMNVLLSKIGLKGGAGFKATVKKVVEAPGKLKDIVLKSFSKTFSRTTLSRRMDYQRHVADPDSQINPEDSTIFTVPEDAGISGEAHRKSRPSIPLPGPPPPPSRPQKAAEPPPPPRLAPVRVPSRRNEDPRQPWWTRVHKVFVPQYLTDLDGVLDPWALLLMLAFCWSVVGIGIWNIVTKGSAGHFYFNFIPLSPYVSLPMVWAVYNSIAPTLFFIYCFTWGPVFQWSTKIMRLLSSLCFLAALVLLWASVPADIDMNLAAVKTLGFVTNVATQANGISDPVILPDGTHLDLTGGWFIGSDPVKYGMPLASATAVLAWSLSEFPDGYKATGTYDSSLAAVRSGADYIKKCFVNQTPGSYLFVAQVGDPADYYPGNVTADHPELFNRTWTRPADDPTFKSNRPVYVLNSTQVGTDLLASSSAALAATAYLFRTSDPPYSASMAAAARGLYAFALSPISGPLMSYCEYVPCVREIPVQRQVPVYDFSEDKDAVVLGTKCWVPQFKEREQTCLLKTETRDCIELTQHNKVYLTREACCQAMVDSGVWSGVNVTRQGTCAVQPGSLTCYRPDVLHRTCYSEAINSTTSVGCTGTSTDRVFPDAATCCSDMQTLGIISPALPGTGLCTPSFSSCYVADLSSQPGPTCVGPKSEADCLSLSKLGFAVSNTSAQCCSFLGTLFGNATLQNECIAANGGTGARRRTLLQSSTSQTRTLTMNKAVTFFNSTSVLDDVAWAAAWLYQLEPSNTTYLNVAEEYLGRHISEERVQRALFQRKAYYIYNWDTAVWGATALLANNPSLSSTYVDDLRQFFLDVWVGSEVVWGVDILRFQRTTLTAMADFQAYRQAQLQLTRTANIAPWGNSFTDSTGTFLYSTCQPDSNGTSATASTTIGTEFNTNFTNIAMYEAGDVPACFDGRDDECPCKDGRDNDCNGLVDDEDPSCQSPVIVAPTLLTDDGLTYSDNTPLPNAAYAAFISLVHSMSPRGPGKRGQKRLRCWALNQVQYILGDNTRAGQSYVVGFGKDPPTHIPHRASSCPVDPATPCSFSNAYLATTPNPDLSLVDGALVAGPNKFDEYTDDRTTPHSAIGVHYNVGLAAALAGILQTGTDQAECGQLTGLYQDLMPPPAV